MIYETERALWHHLIGVGPTGETAAMNPIKKRDGGGCYRLGESGGGCINWATIPSKALNHSVKQVIDRNANPMFREYGDARKLSFHQILKNAERVLS
ncbi:MAG: hypothetical protein VXX24_09010 [Pseudomonadota bacterium]|nr:hypothetical protein [Pseudomonadota bacterium]